MNEKTARKEFHFSCGDSTDGTIGFCAGVKASSREEALEILKRALPQAAEARPCGNEADNDRISYIEIYLNADNIVLNDIDDGEEEVEEES